MFKMSRCMYDVLAPNRDAAAVVVALWWIFGPIFHHFLVSFPCAGAASGTIVTPIGVILSLWCVLLISGRVRPRKSSPFWRPFWHQNRQRPCKLLKNTAQHSKQRKVRFPRPPRMAHCSAQAVNTICFEGVGHVHLGGFGVAFGGHLGSLFDTFEVQGPIWDQKWGSKTQAQKSSKTGPHGVVLSI